MNPNFPTQPLPSFSSNARTAATNYSRDRRPHYNDQNESSSQQAQDASDIGMRPTMSSAMTSTSSSVKSSTAPMYRTGSAIVQQLHGQDQTFASGPETDHSVSSEPWVSVHHDVYASPAQNATETVAATGASFWAMPARRNEGLPPLEEDACSHSSMHLSDGVPPVDYSTAATIAATVPEYPSGDAGEATVRAARSVAHAAYVSQVSHGGHGLAGLHDGRFTADNLLRTSFHAAPDDMEGWVRDSTPSYMKPRAVHGKVSSHKKKKRSSTSSKESRPVSQYTNTSIVLSLHHDEPTSLYMSSIGSATRKSPSSTLATTVGSSTAHHPIGMNEGADVVFAAGGWVNAQDFDVLTAEPDVDSD